MTRAEVLSAVYHWIVHTRAFTAVDAFSSMFKIPPELRIVWMNGLPGTGKSTLAQTIAKWCDRLGCLGASFFCARFGDRNNVQLIFPTIALHLTLHPATPPSFKTAVQAAVKANPDIHLSLPAHQLEKLIVEPLQACASTDEDFFRPNVIVIDALDECKDDQPVSTIVNALSLHADGLRSLRFIVTSRPEAHITTGFRGDTLLKHTYEFQLSSIPPDVDLRDVTIYLEAKFIEFLKHHKGEFDEKWPGKEKQWQLRSMSGGLFIHISTALKYIFGSSDPEEQLDELLGDPSVSFSSATAISPAAHLYGLYLQVMKVIATPQDASRVKTVVGSIVLLKDQLSPQSLESLLDLKRGIVRRTLRPLHSILIVPDVDQPNAVIRIIHPSFSDFLVDSSKCTRADILVDRRFQHQLLSERCLQIMNANLGRNPCNIASTWVANTEIEDLSSRLAASVPVHVQYACRYWSSHLCEGNITQDIIGLITVFTREHLLHWLELSSLMGDMDGAIDALENAQDALQVCDIIDTSCMKAYWMHGC